MPKPRSEPANPIDALMERASRALVRRRYFEAEQACLEALRAAHAGLDYERMARVLLPLEEARRQKRDLAFDADRVSVVSDAVPEEREIKPGCYLVCPPRVGADGRALREAADRAAVAVIVVVREPTTRAGLWPVVALGPVTVRTKVPPPSAKPRASGRSHAKRAPERAPSDNGHAPLPTRSWFLATNERLGDAAIASVEPTTDPLARVEALVKRLEAHPDHEKLHQALAQACRGAMAHIALHGRPKRPLTDAARREKQAAYDSDL